LSDLDKSNNLYTIRPPTLLERLLYGDWRGRVAVFESSEGNLGGTIILTPGAYVDGVKVERYRESDPEEVSYSSDELLFHELGHAHFQETTGIGDGRQQITLPDGSVFTPRRQTEKEIHRRYDNTYTGHLRKGDLTGTLRRKK